MGRLEPLVKANAASRKEYDDAVSNAAMAEAEANSARAGLREAQLELDYTRVESPIAGITGRALRSDGNYVFGPEVLLTRVTRIDRVYALFGMLEAERVRLYRETKTGRLELPANGPSARN